MIWGFQIVFPTLGLAYVAMKLRSGSKLGPYSFAVAGVCLTWCAACLTLLCVQRTRRWIAARTAEWILLYSTVIVGLAIAECLCWIIVIKEPVSGIHDPDTAHCPDLGWRLVPGKAGVGEHGWRGPLRSPGKPEGCFRIVAVGDSTTFGMGCAWEEAWPHQLEKMLNADESWREKHGNTEVVNLGVPAYGPDQALAALTRHGLSYQPDAVIFHLCINDFADVSFDHDWRMMGGITRYKPHYELEDGELVLRRSFAPLPRDARGQIYRPGTRPPRRFRSSVLELLRRSLPTVEDGYCNDHWPIHHDCLSLYAKARPLLWAIVREMAMCSRRAGAEFMVSLSPVHVMQSEDSFPWRVGSFLDEFRQDAAAIDGPAISGVAEHFALGGNDALLLHGDPCHLNQHGNALIAKATLGWVRAHYSTNRGHE